MNEKITKSKKTTKSKIHRQCGRKELNQRNEFELYDQNWRSANKIVPSIDATNITCAEEGLYFGILVLQLSQQVYIPNKGAPRCTK